MKKHLTAMRDIRPSTTRRISRCNTRASEQAIAERLPPSPTLCTRKGKSLYQAFSTSTPALKVTIPFTLTSRYFSMPITSQRSCTKMTDNLVQLRTCPRCGGVYSGHGAVSRADNLTGICPDCGTREALESIGVDEKEQEKILKTIHKICI